MSDIPEDLYVLIRIPDEHIRDGRHSMAQCCGDNHTCKNQVKYSMTVEEWPFDCGYYNEELWCEEHKPEPK